MRQQIYDILLGLTTVDDRRIYQASSIEGKPTETAGGGEGVPFLIYRLGVATPSISDDGEPVAWRQVLEVWVHDDPGSYDRIEAVLDEVRTLLTTATTDPPFVKAEWSQDGPELFDDIFGTITRWGRFNIVRGRPA